MIDLAKLRAPFPPDRISWRVGSTTGDKKKGMALAYIDARDVQDRLDDVCGPGGWQCEHYAIGQKTACRIGLLFGDMWVWRSDGAGDTDFEADKGALSDAFKRAGVKWGIGRYLYDVSAPWVAIEQAGKSYKIVESELPKLMKLLGSYASPPSSAPTPKSNPGISKVREWLNKQGAEIHACEDVDQFVAYLTSIHSAAVKLLREHPQLWQGEEESAGLRGVVEQRAAQIKATSEARDWIERVKTAAMAEQRKAA